MKYTKANWKEYINARDTGETVEIDEEIFDYFLDVLPPIYMHKEVTLRDGSKVRASFGFAEGREPITAFWSRCDKGERRYFCQKTTQMNPYA